MAVKTGQDGYCRSCVFKYPSPEECLFLCPLFFLSSTSLPRTPQGRPLLDRKSTPHSQTPSLPATKGARRTDNLTAEEPATATRPSRSNACKVRKLGKESQTRRTNPAQCATDYAKRAEDRSCAPLFISAKRANNDVQMYFYCGRRSDFHHFRTTMPCLRVVRRR